MAVFAADDFSKCTVADFSFSLKSMDLILDKKKSTASAPFCQTTLTFDKVQKIHLLSAESKG